MQGTNTTSPAESRSLQLFSFWDIGLSALFLGLIIAIWYVGDFHTLHHSDSVLYSLMSLYRWTVFAWEYDHSGAFLSLVLSFIHRPYWNLLATSTLCSFSLLMGFALWASLLSFRRMTLTESSLWASLLLPLAVPKDRLFDNAAHVSLFGISLFFAGLFTCAQLYYMQLNHRGRRWLLACVLFILGFLAIYLAKSTIVPLAAIALGLIWESSRLAVAGEGCDDGEDGPLFPLNLPFSRIIPLLSLGLALAIYQILEAGAAVRADFTYGAANVPIALPRLFKNWIDHELTTPILVLIPLPFFFYKPASWYQKNPLLSYLALGVALEVLIVSSSRWVVLNQFGGSFLTDLSFLLILMIIAVVTYFARSGVSKTFYRGLLATVAAVSLFVNAREWNSFSPNWPFSEMDRTIGAQTQSLVESQCDVLAGDYWRVWPAVMAVNDYYYREGIMDPRTHTLRTVAGLAMRAGPTEYLWRPRLNWPDVKICGFGGDDAGFREAFANYAPEVALQIEPGKRFDRVVAYDVRKVSMSSVRLDFDLAVPGAGWFGIEANPAGDTFQWMSATTSTVILPLVTERDVSVTFRILYSMAPDILRSLSLSVNDQPVPLSVGHDQAGAPIFHATIPRLALAGSTPYTRLAFRINRTARPMDTLPDSLDPRPLGLAFDWLEIQPAGE